jgi:hypothetical protein
MEVLSEDSQKAKGSGHTRKPAVFSQGDSLCCKSESARVRQQMLKQQSVKAFSACHLKEFLTRSNDQI